MKLAVIGAGPAGLTAAYRLQQAGHQVEVLEALNVIGGRTHAEHFGPGHHCDTGAGWLATFYTHTRKLFDELGFSDVYLQPRTVRGAADLLIDGKLSPWPFRGPSVETSALLTPEDKVRYGAYIDHLMKIQSTNLTPDLAYDMRNAADEFAPLGKRTVDIIMRTMFEGPFFSRLDTLSATMVRLWLRPLQDGFFFQVKGGMDAPWLKLAERLSIRTGEAVAAVRSKGNGVEVSSASGGRDYDGVVMAVPAPAAARMLVDQPELAPSWLGEVQYAPQIRVYAAKQTTDDAHFGVHLLPPTDLFSIEWYSGRHGAWGACPADWQWGLVCTFGPTCAKFLDQADQTVMQQLWEEARTVAPGMFSLAEADVVHYHRWEWAVPVMGPGHYRHLAAHQHRPPVVFAGDWMNNACVEGAVRSGEAAATAFGKA